MKQKRLLLIAVGLLLISAWVSFLVFQANTSHSASARQHLTQALNQPMNDRGVSPQLTPELPTENAGDELGAKKEHSITDGLFNIPLPISPDGIGLQEDENGYEITVPLTKPDDAEQVSVHVTPHHIEVSGETATQSDDTHSPGFSARTQFMQSFDTNEEVIPGHVSRTLKHNNGQVELHITVPKKRDAAVEKRNAFPENQTNSFDDPEHPVF
jgi:HSP20 family molecular chaperone IbpA